MTANSINVDVRLFKDTTEMQETVRQAEQVRSALRNGQMTEATDGVIAVLRTLWRHYSIDRYADIFLNFARAQKALYGPELTTRGGRYRDHLIHVFNVYISGLLLFSKMMAIDYRWTSRLLILKPESRVIPFPNPYDEARRLSYLWSLASTFHDIAIPIDHMEELVSGLNEYFKFFKIKASDLPLSFPRMSPVSAGRYFDLMAIMFSRGVRLAKGRKSPSYFMSGAPSRYLVTTLSELFDESNHGVLAAYFLFDSLEDTFLGRQHSDLRYDLDVAEVVRGERRLKLPPQRKNWIPFLIQSGVAKEQVNSMERSYDSELKQTQLYRDYVLAQDVTRAGLCIALHSINPATYPKIFPIKFSKLPVAWILILMDECQEYYRPEGLSLAETIRFTDFPTIDVQRVNGQLKIRIYFNFDTPTEKTVKTILRQYNNYISDLNLNKKVKLHEVNGYEPLVRATWERIFSTLEQKLSFDDSGPALKVGIEVNGHPPERKPLGYESVNW